MARGDLERKRRWSEAVAVGRRSFVEEVQQELGTRARYRHVDDIDGLSVLRESVVAYCGHVDHQIDWLSAKLAVNLAES